MLRVFVEGVGLVGPGLNGWGPSAAILRGEAPYEFVPAVVPSLDLLPAAERRRTVPTVKLALAVAHAAMLDAGCDPKDVATVFASSGGDGETIESILETLTTEAREVSPTRFHNSVHNAPAGYWAIATGCRAPSVSLCAHDATFAAALLEGALQASCDARPIGLNIYDAPYPKALGIARPILGSFGVGLVLAPTCSPTSVAALGLTLEHPSGPHAVMAEPALERLRTGNPAARSLPFLEALAKQRSARLSFENSGADALIVDVAPLKNG
jgi:Beta-ketoacyl synthase, N-terminal domain